MPQTSPMNWMTIPIFFLVTTKMMNTMNDQSNKNNKKSLSSTMLKNWKW